MKFKVTYSDGFVEVIDKSDCDTVEEAINATFGRELHDPESLEEYIAPELFETDPILPDGDGEGGEIPPAPSEGDSGKETGDENPPA